MRRGMSVSPAFTLLSTDLTANVQDHFGCRWIWASSDTDKDPLSQ